MRPVDGGDEVRVPLANVNLSAANITEQQMRVDMVTKLVAAGFTPDAACEAVGLPSIGFSEGEPVTLESRDLTVADTVQKVYLGVGPVLTTDEAREIVNAAGANLSVPGPQALGGDPAPTTPNIAVASDAVDDMQDEETP